MPLGSNLATPRGSIVSFDLLWEKHSNIGISKASRWILIKLPTHHHWAVGKVTSCIWADLEVWLPWQHINFNEKKSSRLTALKFSMWQCLMVLCIIVPIMPVESNLATPWGLIVSIVLLLISREPSPVLGRGGDITCYSWFEYNFG